MDIFNRDKIFELKIQLEKVNKELDKTKRDLKDTNFQLRKYKSLVKNEHYTVQDLTNLIDNLTEQKDKLKSDISTQAERLKNLTSAIDENYLKSVGYKEPANYSHELKPKIIENKSIQKDYIKNRTAIIFDYYKIAVEGSEFKGKQLINNISDLMLASFNLQCDNIISKLTLSNIEQSATRLKIAENTINRRGELLDLSINAEYFNLKLKELYLQYEYLNLLEQEKEKKEHEKEILKDQAKADKELSKLEEKQERELNDLKYQYNLAVTKNKELHLIDELKAKIDQLEHSVNITKRSLREQKCGYLYVVGCRDMLKGQLKIGITKRTLEDRMKELANASHSYPMEIYGSIFVDDCYAVETKIHQYLDNKRVNVNNKQKEWFYVTFEEVKQALKEQCGLDIELNEHPCQDYLDSKEKFEFLS